MIDDDGNGRNAHATGNRVVCAPKCNIERADLALHPFGMQRRSFARGRQLQRAIRQTLVEAHTDRFLHSDETPSDGGIVDAEQSCSRCQRSSSTDG